MTRLTTAHPRSRGFSLIEVMIAVVVLATGLLALAALQGSLTRSSSEAKVRGRVAAMLSARMDELRTSGYGTLVNGTVTTTSTIDPCNDGDATDWIDCTRVQTGVGSLSSTQVVATWSGTATFTQVAPPVSAVNPAEFKRVSLTATWTDAANNPHQLALASDISALGLTNGLIPPPDDTSSGGGGPVVRTTSPATAGVIPIALGNGSSSAASNPTPEIVGKNNNQEIVGTRFNVLTYAASGVASQIQKRFENELVKCTCQYGAGGNNFANFEPIYRNAQWPVVWTGDRYDLFEPTPVSTAAPGQSAGFSGPKSGVTQSPLCQECCRDHHDPAVSTEGRFDPERVIQGGEATGKEKYNPNGSGTLVKVPDTSTATYINSCRIIRVDGFWRTAPDMYSRQFGLLETQTVSGKVAKTGLPTSAATSAYESFVKNYLKQYSINLPYDGTEGRAPSSTVDASLQNAKDVYSATTNINDPTTIPIASPSNSDFRYLHARGLYADFLEKKAREKLVDVLADNGAGGRCPTAVLTSNIENCVLPFLPFTTINLTELAKWQSSNTSILTVNSQNQLATDPTQPFGGRTLGANVGTANNQSSARPSNSGVAASTLIAGGVDPEDIDPIRPGTDTSDTQPFQIGGVASTGDPFDVRVSGGGLNPFVFYSILTDTGECLKPVGGDHRCSTNTSLGLVGGSVRLQNYWVLTTVSTPTASVLNGIQCTYGGVNVTIQTNGQNANINVPAFRNYAVTAATMNGTPGTIGAAVNDNKLTESTTVSFAAIPASGLARVTLAEQSGSPTKATLVSCTASKQGSNYYFGSAVWSKPWELP